MRGLTLIVLLMALLVTAYLVAQDLRSRQAPGTTNIEAIEKAKGVHEKVNRSSRAQEERLRKLAGE